MKIIFPVVAGVIAFLSFAFGYHSGKEDGILQGTIEGTVRGHKDIMNELVMSYLNCGVYVEDKRCVILYDTHKALETKYKK